MPQNGGVATAGDVIGSAAEFVTPVRSGIRRTVREARF